MKEMIEDKIKSNIDTFLANREDLFLMELKITPNNEVEVLIDGDQGVSVKDCLDLSRQIENNVDREQEDYALKVSSYGALAPLLEPRQYKKNIGRKLKVDALGEKFEGKLEEANDEYIILKWKERVPKKVGKGKTTEEFTKEIEYKDIEKAIIKITF